MPSAQEQTELNEIEEELSKLARQQQQLLSRKQLLTVLQHFKHSTGFISTDKKALTRRTDSTEKTELESIDEQLRDIAEQEGVLLNRKEEILCPDQFKPDLSKLNGLGMFVLPRVSDEFAIAVPPPSFPAPQLTLDYNKLTDSPTPTQCPSCQQFVTTEISRKVGNTVWLLCIMAVMFGCFLGCCLIPFCINAHKDVVHMCPKCRSTIHTMKRL
ncbi:cell death-inducing p53-target protein 1-like [Polyodon spathula]|uniref:cell death-inducing p53-target protein 1-like n=1 Tax=Polyodon spathula TaxID=7913 RepID=UPI001B7F77E6|nr:cell death-inducing p53-target protein 1-like [Polyodon spathula]